MSVKQGKLYTCDRCGAHVFLRCLGELSMNGGFTRYAKYEDFPDGWMMNGERDLCPKCSKLYRNMIKQFMGDERTEEQTKV